MQFWITTAILVAVISHKMPGAAAQPGNGPGNGPPGDGPENYYSECEIKMARKFSTVIVTHALARAQQ